MTTADLLAALEQAFADVEAQADPRHVGSACS
jgi:hypothetical protein